MTTVRPRPARPATAPLAGVLATTLLMAAVPSAANAQAPSYSPGQWNQVETEHFLFLYPTELSEWALDMARRMEAVHGAVAALVGFAPEDRVTVVVDDPTNVPNGSMNPGPTLFMWPTPPNPRSMVGEHRGWGELLAVHEFAHAAHLTRPTRNPRQRLLYRLIPVPVHPIMARSPRWVTEGYATYVEGRVTGHGRPHGVWRPAVLRTRALEGRLPSYGAMNMSPDFYGGAMAYLMGSAFLEWLVEAEGGDEEVLPNVWRRFTARQVRSFDAAFTGVFGYPPPELYGRFTVDVTERALAVRDAVEAAGGVVDGELFQRLSWLTGDPAVSADGEHLAMVLRSRDLPPRMVVVSTTPDTLTTAQVERRARIFELDPEDVEPVERRPRAQRAKATLWPTVGRGYDMPAFLPDGRILVVRSDLVEGGRARPDLFIWDWEGGGVSRVTRGEAIREASPSPDGTWAAGVRCVHSLCDVVRIDLATGDVATVAAGRLLRPYAQPRVSPDGRTIVAAVQEGTTWRLVAMDADGGNERPIGPDDGAARFDPAFLPDGGSLVLTSTRGGIPDLETMDLATGHVRPLTRVLGAAVAPAPTPDGDVFFLSLHSRGWDVHRIPADAPPPAVVVVADPSLSPAAPVPPVVVDTFPAAPIGPVRPYGLGPRFVTLLPIADVSVDGYGGGLALAGTDPIGRFSWQLQGLYGSDDATRGAALRALWRGTRPWLHGSAFLVDDPFPVPFDELDPVEPPGPGQTRPEYDRRIDGTYYGAAASLELWGARVGRSHSARAGGSVGAAPGPDTRALGFVEYHVGLRQTPGTWRLTQRGQLHASGGRTGELDWTRWLASGRIEAQGRRFGVALAGTVGGTDAPPGSIEAFSVGGVDPLLLEPAIVAQRVAMPALPAGRLRGDAVRTARAELIGLAPFRPFFWTGSVDGDTLGWYNVAGLEIEGDAEGMPVLRMPSFRFRLGLARTLSEPDEGAWRAWAMIGYRP